MNTEKLVKSVNTHTQNIIDINSSLETIANKSNVFSLMKRQFKFDTHIGYKNINVIGDSISHGANAPDVPNDCWTGVMRKFLQLEYNTRNHGYVSMQPTISNSQGTYQDMHLIEIIGTWDKAVTNRFLGLYKYQSEELGAKIIFKPQYKSKFICIHYEASPFGGKININACGKVIKTFDCYDSTGTYMNYRHILDISSLPEKCVFEIEKTDTKTVIIHGITYYDDNTEMMFNNYAKSGSTLGTIDNKLLELMCDTNVMFFCIGHNDDYNTPIDTFRSKIDICINALKTRGSFVVVVDFIWRRAKDNEHRLELQRLAKETNGIYICFDELYGNNVGNMITNGFLSDESHPTPQGHQIIAEKIAKVLGLSVNSKLLAQKMLLNKEISISKNIIKNGDFENGISTNWTFWNNPTNANVVIASNLGDNYQIGVNTPYIKVANGVGDITTNGIMESDTIVLIPNTEYKVKLKYQNHFCSSLFRVWDMDSNKAVIEKYIASNNTSETVINGTLWKDFAYSFNSNSIKRVKIQLVMVKAYASANDSKFVFDEVMFGY